MASCTISHPGTAWSSPSDYPLHGTGWFRETRGGTSATRALLAAIHWPTERTTLSYQSKFGFEKWLTPATADVLSQLPSRSVRRVAVITPGFVTEGLETLEEIGIQGRESFLHAGGESYLRIGAAEAHPAMLRSLLAIALDPPKNQRCALAECGRGRLCCALPRP